MTTEVSIFNSSELALAAYANLQEGLSANQILALTEDGVGMTQTQAEQFAVRWPEIVAQYADPVTGLSVTVFRNGSEVNIAIRGTEGLNFQDLFADLQLGIGQIPEQYTALKNFYETLKSSGQIQETDNLTISGHSLGGFLAQLLAVDYGTDFEHTYTFNAPGIGGVPLDLFGITNNISIAAITNIRGDGFSVISTVGTSLGAVEEIQIENSLFSPADHTIKKLTDSLSVFNALLQLDSTFTIKSYNDTFKASSNNENQSLESIVNNIGKLFQVNVNVFTDDREGLHAGLEAINTEIYIDPSVNNPQLKPQYQNLQIVDVTSLSGSAKDNDADGYAYRYALVNLLPFAVTGNFAIYGTHNTNGELDIVNFSNQYLQDRAYMVAQVLQTRINDASVVLNPQQEVYKNYTSETGFDELVTITLPAGANRNLYKQYVFGNEDSNPSISGSIKDDHLYGGGGNDTIHGGEGSDYIEGNTGDDQLHGDDGRDYLYGGAGADNLFGGKGDDYLSGGGGADIYHYSTGDGNDTIIDADQSGDLIYVNGVNLATLTFKAFSAGSNVFVANGDDADPYNDIIFIDGNGEGFIGIAGANGTGGFISLNNFTAGSIGTLNGTAPYAGDFDIKLSNPEELDLAPPTSPDIIVVGDGFNTSVGFIGRRTFNVRRNIFYQSSFYYDGLLYPNSGSAGLHRFDGGFNADYLYGNPFISNYLYGGYGDDAALPSSGVNDDLLVVFTAAEANARGLTDIDNVQGTTEAFGNNLLIGALGSDTIVGSEAHDYIVGNDEDGFFSSRSYILNDGAPSLATPFSYGNHGDPTIDPELGEQYLIELTSDQNKLYGRDGVDHIVGGGYNDLIDGGADGDFLAGRVGNDQIFGGAGDDVIYGDADLLIEGYAGGSYQLGMRLTLREQLQRTGELPITSGTAGVPANDTLDGGSGNDVLVGEFGRDTIYGGDGNDIIQGDRLNDIETAGVIAQGTISSHEHGLHQTWYNHLAGEWHDNDTLLGGSGADTIYGNGGADFISGGSGDDILYGDDEFIDQAFHGDDIIFGGGGNDTIYGGSGEDTLYGDAGDDVIEAGDGDDTLIGGSGTDRLTGEAGNDRYLFGPGSGVTTVDNSGDFAATNTIVFSGGYKPINALSDTQVVDAITGSVSRRLDFGNGDVLITVGTYNSLIAQEQFEIGGALQSPDPTNLIASVLGITSGDDVSSGTGGDQVLLGSLGHDILLGAGGSDTYIVGFGEGTDVIDDRGSAVGDADRIVFAPEITPENTIVSRIVGVNPDTQVEQENLFVDFGGGNTLTVRGYFSDPESTIESIEFSDGTVWDMDTVNSLLVAPPNSAPIATDDSAETDEDTSVVLNVSDLLSNDTDLEGDSLSITDVSNALNGSVNLDTQTQQITFTPNGNYHGPASFDYVVSDGVATDTAIVNVAVASVNDAPVASVDMTETDEDTALVINAAELLVNDSDVDGNTLLSITSVSNALNGSVSLDTQKQQITFTPNGNYYGPASFDYVVSDGVATDTAIVNIAVASVNDAPVASNDMTETVEDTAVVLNVSDLLSNDTDLEGDSLGIIDVSNALNGNAVFDSEAGTITFTPDDFYSGAASFDYQLSDGLLSTKGTVNVDVLIDKLSTGYIGGTTSSETIRGTKEANRIYGLEGDDVIEGGKGDDRIVGGAGNDTLSGARGDDTYIVTKGDGTDTIDNSSSKSQDTDSLWFAGEFDPEILWFSQNSNDLVIDVIGTDDQVIVQGWYKNSSNEIEEVHINDQVLLSNQVDQLVQAMAAINTGEPSDLASLSQQQQDDFSSAIAASWQAA